MSGVEIIGLALGVLPILLKSVDLYKDSIRRAGTAIRKRKYVEKLARALLLQQQILEETVKSVILSSGCENTWDLDDDPFTYFKDESIREQVEDYLGPKNTVAFVGILERSNDTVKKVARNITGLVPTYKDPTDDLVGIIHANKEKSDILVDIAPRVKLLLGITDMKATIQDLDEATSALDRFARIILSNRQTIQSSSSRKAVKLAKALRHVRAFASSLYLAIFQGWSEGCHGKHEARLYLDDRVDIAANFLQRVGKADSEPLLIFDLVFAAGVGHGEVMYYETAVQVFGEDDCYDDYRMQLDNMSLGSSRLTLVVPASISSPKPEVASVTNICDAIQEAKGTKQRVSFALIGSQRIGTIPDEKNPYQLEEAATDAISLKDILSSDNAPLPWKFRMQLALRLASSLLQLLQTQWLRCAWSKDVVFLLVLSTGENTIQVDLNRPFIASTFGHGLLHEQRVEPKVALLELGILLLEIWHKTTLEARFSLGNPPVAYYDRMARAVEWLDDVHEPLPDLYDKAVAHCLRVNIGGESRFLDWEDPKLWNVICGDIIEPLSKICKQWSG